MRILYGLNNRTNYTYYYHIYFWFKNNVMCIKIFNTLLAATKDLTFEKFQKDQLKHVGNIIYVDVY